ncbi:Hypothetical protein CINCED_3A012902 [Cinara cedri]|uniref:Uncharacterized protein n=1 Tax=Cinara cedri TaxID=506608 RepID=A0A5E4N2C5_9HEMI|nr:Hypothetical protein CINCED_3A012902 [Cinara cedri]
MFSSQSSINTECSKKSTKTIDSISTKNSSKKVIAKPQDLKKLDSTFTKALVNIDQLDNNKKSTTDTCIDYINSCHSGYLESMENRACRIVIENSQAALYAVCQRLLDTCTHNEILQNENTRLKEEIYEKKSFEQIAAEQIAIVEHNLMDKVNDYANISETVKENYLAKIRFIMVTLDELESMVEDEVKEIIQKLKLDLEITDPESQNYKQLLEKYEKVVKRNVQLEEMIKKQEDLETKIINLTNEKNALAAKIQNIKPKSTNLMKNRLDALATPRRRADIENIAPKDKTYILKSKTVNVKPIAQSSPLREMNR